MPENNSEKESEAEFDSKSIEDTVLELFKAAERNDENEVKRMVEEGVPVTSLDELDQTLAHIASKNGNLNLIKYVAQKDPTILEALDFYGENVLFPAIDGGHFDIVKYLVETRGMDISKHYKKCFGNTAIHKAAESGSLVILKYFIEDKNGNINVENSLKQTPILLAAESKHHDVIKYLFEEKNADLKHIDYRKYNILFVAINSNDLKLIEYILDEKKVAFDVNEVDLSHITLVHRAAILNRFDILKYLVSKKHADVNIPDKWGKTPLQSAARWNYYDACKFLIENGAKIDVKDHEGKSPIKEASDKDLIDYMTQAMQKRDRRSIH